MKNAKKTIGSVLWLLGLTLAICTPDNCQHEIAFRLAGVLLFAIGAYLAEAYDFQEKENEQTERREDHDPYPEEMVQHPVGEIK